MHPFQADSSKKSHGLELTCSAQFPIAPAALPVVRRDFVPWRFSDAGRQSVRATRHSRRPKTCTNSTNSEVATLSGGLGEHGKKSLCLRNFRKFRRRREAFERRCEHGMGVGGTV